uniref:Uncharacterized protein n=1 Tax=Arundo donax TaxID=35708 RepID=A0A0A9AAU1_ARUDO
MRGGFGFPCGGHGSTRQRRIRAMVLAGCSRTRWPRIRTVVTVPAALARGWDGLLPGGRDGYSGALPAWCPCWMRAGWGQDGWIWPLPWWVADLARRGVGAVLGVKVAAAAGGGTADLDEGVGSGWRWLTGVRRRHTENMAAMAFAEEVGMDPSEL